MAARTIRNKALIAALAIAAIAESVVACSSDNDPNPLLIATCQLQEFTLHNEMTVAIDDPLQYIVTFKTDGTANIQSDCNHCSEGFTANEDSLSFGNFACTLSACAPGSFVTRFQVALSSVSTYPHRPKSRQEAT